MKTSPASIEQLRRSVLAVPPLCRDRNLGLDQAANRALCRHLSNGGVTTVLWGGNANLYNMSLGEFGPFLDMIEDIAAPQDWIIPSIGADYGKAFDQAVMLRARAFPTAMLLPLRFPSTPSGVATGVRRVADRLGRPLIAYVKDEHHITPSDLGALMRDGAVWCVKYAIVRSDPSSDAELSAIIDAVGADRVVSGIGERPVIDHFAGFGLKAFTSGSVCVAPRLSMDILRALERGDIARATELRGHFLPLEDLRDRISPARVLHEAVRLAGIADTGPMLPMLSNITDPNDLAAIARAASELSAANDRAATEA